MKTAFRLLPVTVVALLLTAPVAFAHHSFAMFDHTVEKVATGTVARWAAERERDLFKKAIGKELEIVD